MSHAVVLLGDSIRLAYQPVVTLLLQGFADIWGPEENCRFAKHTARQLPSWFAAAGQADLIHWNNGLWDTSILYPEDGPFTPLDEYLRYLAIILRELRKRCPKIIFATSTPVVEPHASQKNSLIEEYNQAAVDFMRKQGVMINDLYAFVYPRQQDFICDDRCHPTELGKKVAEIIREQLA